MINVEIHKEENENNITVLRRFTKRVQESGVLTRARSLQYRKRAPSAHTKKQSRLTQIERERVRERLLKLGKPLPEKKRGRERR